MCLMLTHVYLGKVALFLGKLQYVNLYRGEGGSNEGCAWLCGEGMRLALWERDAPFPAVYVVLIRTFLL